MTTHCCEDHVDNQGRCHTCGAIVDAETWAEYLGLRSAMWAGDVDRLQELAPCVCCCHEHTFPCCEARLWGGCRGGLPYGYGPEDEARELRSWQEHYARFHGMSEAQFFDIELS